jgi:hypothetical protein
MASRAVIEVFVKLLLVLALASGRGELTSFGNKWGWTGTGEAFVPQLVMYATPPHFYGDPAKVDRDIERFLKGHGFNGFHVFLSCRWFDIEEEDCRKVEGADPALDPRTFEALEMRIRKTHAAGGMVHLWAWGDEERGQTPSARPDWGGLAGPVARKVEREIARRLGPLPGWSMGYGFDLDEWVTVRDIQGWHDRLQGWLPRFHFLGGRPGGPNRGLNHERFARWNRGLDYASYEHHEPTYAVYASALDANPDKPVMSEDRFRVLKDDDDKHYSLPEIRRGLWHSMMAGGVANIWGYLMDGGTHELGSAPFPNRLQLKSYFEFVRGRFRRDMTRCSPAGADPQREAVCLVTEERDHFLFYREDAERVVLELGGMRGAQPAVAIDARRAYAEVAVGVLEPGTRIWRAPYRSDWALAVGRFPWRAVRTDTSIGPSISAPSAPAGLGVVSDLVPETYRLARLGEGDRYYLDRDYELSFVPPALDGAVWVRTANDNKMEDGDTFIAFDVSRPVTVYVGFDPRASSLPHWLRGWEATGERLYVTGDGMGHFELYRRRFRGGRVELGGNSAKGADWGEEGRSHYVVAVVPQ